GELVGAAVGLVEVEQVADVGLDGDGLEVGSAGDIDAGEPGQLVVEAAAELREGGGREGRGRGGHGRTPFRSTFALVAKVSPTSRGEVIGAGPKAVLTTTMRRGTPLRGNPTKSDSRCQSRLYSRRPSRRRGQPSPPAQGLSVPAMDEPARGTPPEGLASPWWGG